jgi:hypothetical protein
LYDLLIHDGTIGFIDRFIALLDEDNIGSSPELAELARWLATRRDQVQPRSALSCNSSC